MQYSIMGFSDLLPYSFYWFKSESRSTNLRISKCESGFFGSHTVSSNSDKMWARFLLGRYIVKYFHQGGDRDTVYHFWQGWYSDLLLYSFSHTGTTKETRVYYISTSSYTCNAHNEQNTRLIFIDSWARFFRIYYHNNISFIGLSDDSWKISSWTDFTFVEIRWACWKNVKLE